MLNPVDAEELQQASAIHDDSDRHVRMLSDKVARLQAEVAALRARHVRAEERDVGVGSLPTEREASTSEVEQLANVGTWSWDVRTNAVAWSAQAFRIFGYDPAVDLASQAAFFAALHPEDREIMTNASVRTATTGITAPAPRCRFIHKDGSVRHVILAGTPIYDQAGQLIRIAGAALDITEFVAVESELRRTARLLNDAERMAGLGSWSWSASSQIIEWSENMRRIFGVAPSTPIDSELFFDRVHPDDRDHVQSSGHCSADGRAPQVEFRICCPDGSLRHARMEASVERDERGRVSRMMGTVQDITSRAQLEQQLRHAQRMDAIGTFAGGIAHDFNNYLMVIQGNVELIRTRSAHDTFERNRLEEIAIAAGSCAALTRQLLSLARREMSAPRIVEVASLVSHSAPLLRRMLGDQVELVLAPPTGHTIVRIDPAQLEQVLVNLSVNARDAMPDGGVVTIELAGVIVDSDFASTRPLLGSGPYVRIGVKDTGTGIPVSIRSRIFEPFVTTKARGKGTGLGLSTVYGIVKQWRGHIEFESELGRGTEFLLWLPAHPGPADSTREDEPAPSARGRETVLLAEDEPQVRRLIHTVLEQAGYCVLVAEDGQHALSVAKNAAHVDLLLSDVRMPHLGGVGLARQLRGIWPGIKVLLMSGYPDIDAVNAREVGLSDTLLAKPFGTSELLDRVRSELDRTGLA